MENKLGSDTVQWLLEIQLINSLLPSHLFTLEFYHFLKAVSFYVVIYGF